MARLESGKMNPNLTWCDVQDLFNSVLNHFDSEFKGHNVKIEIAKNMPFIKADYILIEQVLKNIVQNAITYTPQNAQIELHSYFDDNNCYIAVSDNGPGVPESQLIHIFDKFYRINSSVTGGSGLGLSIVKGIVEAHGGTITVSNKITGGLRFLITLPQDFNNNKSVKNNID
jgi:two-component system sensor histidine kinase KdpD